MTKTNGERRTGRYAPTAPQRRRAGEPIKLGSMLFTLVEPHRGHEVAYNRWYERDHFYAGCMIGPYQFAGKRFVATAALKALRDPDSSRPPGAEPQTGSYLGVYWVLDGYHDDWNRWAVDQVMALHGPAGCSTSATTSTPFSTATPGSTPATRTACRPSSPSTTDRRGWWRCSTSRRRGHARRVRDGCATSTSPRLLPGRLVVIVTGPKNPFPLLRRSRGRAPQRSRRSSAADLVVPRPAPAGVGTDPRPPRRR